MTPKEFLNRLIEHCGGRWHVKKEYGFEYKTMRGWEENTPLSWMHNKGHRERLEAAVKALKLTQEEIESLKPQVTGPAAELKKLRRDMGLSQIACGELIGYGVGSISAIECGKYSAEKALRLLKQYQKKEKAPIKKEKTPTCSTKKVKNTGATHILNGEPVRIVEISGRYRGFRKFGNDWQRSEYVETNIIHATPIGRRSAA